MSNCQDGAVAAYKYLSGLRSNKKKKRRYVEDCFHQKVYDTVRVIGRDRTNVDLVLRLSNGKTSTVQIRRIQDDEGEGLRREMMTLCKSLENESGNARQRTKEFGEMYTMGLRDAKNGLMYKPTEGREGMIQRASSLFSEWLERNLLSTYQSITKAEEERMDMVESVFPKGPGSSMVISMDLGNYAHYDINDRSVSVSLWLEKVRGRAKNWYFILPNVEIDGSRGAAIELTDGTVISWDGSLVYHCTSVTEVGEDNPVFGCWYGSRSLRGCA